MTIPEIIGLGIEEEYADALAAIHDAQRALGPQQMMTHMPERQILLELKWVEQEILARRLPIPVDQSYVNTIYYLVGSNELARYPGFQAAIGTLSKILDGTGLLKTRHYPMIAALIEEFLADADRIQPRLPDSDRSILNDLCSIANELRNGRMPAWRRPQDTFSALATEALEQGVSNGANRLRSIDMPLFDNWRPRPARKPPLRAPVPGLPDRASSLPPEREGRLS